MSEFDVPLKTVSSLQVKAIHDYASTDSDELELKTGEVVLALAFDCPDEQVSCLRLWVWVRLDTKFQMSYVFNGCTLI